MICIIRNEERVGKIILVLMKGVVILFEKSISRLTLAIDDLPGCGFCKRNLIRSGSYYWAVLLVKCPELGGKMAIECGVYVCKSGCREDPWTWDVPKRVKVKIEDDSGENVQWHLYLFWSVV